METDQNVEGELVPFYRGVLIVVLLQHYYSIPGYPGTKQINKNSTRGVCFCFRLFTEEYDSVVGFLVSQGLVPEPVQSL